MHKKANIISNIIICSVLLTVSFFVLTVDISETYVGITAPLYSGNTHTNSVSIMFVVDDNTDSNTITQISNTLQNARSNATFFVSGRWVTRNIETTRTLAEKYELGNYGFTATKLNIGDKNKIKSEIENCHNLVLSATNIRMNLFSPPEQKYNKNTLSVAENLGYKTILPTQKDNDDYSAGDLILLPANDETAKNLARIISGILAKNLHIVRVGDNIG
ncbi:MAG: polysaccharide deacetylase family protein [Christensenellaceae bacterium]|jgi:peptidoglycan/xylan/chitin deacetylase (PgdA/CDA1 family)|nr:polysaccharide deacetylase family protein [Christensenellaceae bacterium]